MPINVIDVIDILQQICDDANLRVTVKESVKSGVIAGVSTTLGGLLGGPVGVAVGGTIGVAAATYMAQGKFKPVSQVLAEMTPAQKQQLFDKSVAIFENVGVEDLATFGRLAVGDSAIRDELLSVIVDQVSGQMKMQIMN